MLNKTIEKVTQAIIERSQASRQAYLAMCQQNFEQTSTAQRLSCSNWAHVVAANDDKEKQMIPSPQTANLAIVSAYNDMLSAHQPFAQYPAQIKLIARSMGATAQVAGGVPAMCDGVTQGQPGMELSLISRDVIAMATAVSLSHDVYEGVICLGVCDKIVPGMFIGAAQFGHLPLMFIPSGPMPSGISNKEKAEQRQLFAQGKISKEQLLNAESAAYHSPGTCTFYGTANTNQVLMEALGLQLAGTSFINPGTPLRQALTEYSVKQLLGQTRLSESYQPFYKVVSEKSFVNAMVLLSATGGSTNLSLHLIAMANACGIGINWQDLDQISRATPLLTRVYPNGQADVNQFEQAGGLAVVISELQKLGLLNDDVNTVMGRGLSEYAKKPHLSEASKEASAKKQLIWNACHHSLDKEVISDAAQPFDKEGGLRLMQGNIGVGMVKISAVANEHRAVQAPCKVFESQEAFKRAFESGELNCDHVAVVRFQGPVANGMPELHKLTPYLGILQDKGYQVALLTDGRMSGASGKVLAAIHVSPEACRAGLLAKLCDGDVIRVDANCGEINVLQAVDKPDLVTHNDVLEHIQLRKPAQLLAQQPSVGRGLFSSMRSQLGSASDGASIFEFGE